MTYKAPLATTTDWGIVRVGTGINVTNGVISATPVVALDYGFFYDTTSQLNPVASGINVVSWNTTGTADQISISGTNLLTVTNAGTYLKVFTLSFAKTTSGAPTVADVWVRYNGVDVVESRQQIAVPNQLSALFITGNYTLDMAAGGTMGMCWSSPDTAVQLQAFPTAIGPVRPAIPSAKITLTRIS